MSGFDPIHQLAPRRSEASYAIPSTGKTFQDPHDSGKVLQVLPLNDILTQRVQSDHYVKSAKLEFELVGVGDVCLGSAGLSQPLWLKLRHRFISMIKKL